MSEEKELEEQNPEDSELSSDIMEFVDLADFSDLGDLSSIREEDVFGDLGDLTELGDLPDLSDLADLLPKDTAEMELSADSAEEEMADVMGSIPSDLFPEGMDMDLFAENVEQTPVPDEQTLKDVIPEEADIMEDLSSLEEPDLSQEMGLEDAIGADFGLDIPMEFDVAEPQTVEEAEKPIAMEETVIAEEPIAMEETVIAEEPIAMEETVIAEEPMAMEEAFMPEEPAEADGVGLLDGLDLDFGVSMESVEEEMNTQAENIDDMLGNLLDDLDMSGTMEESAAGMDGAAMDFGEETQTDDIAQMLGLGEEEMDGSDFSSDSNLMDSLAMMPEETAENPKQEKTGFFKRVFGNIVTDEIAQAERDAAEKEKEELAKLEEEEAKNKEELEIKKAEKKAQKEAKAAERKKEKAEKKARLAEEKAAMKAQREEEEAAELEVVGKLNKVGVSIIVIATILFLTIEIAGTNMFGYISTKNKAIDYFDMGKYTEAYAQAIGTDMKEKDPEEYDRIKVVMQVQQSLNAYNNYDRMKYYPEALNALLNGVRKYDANIEQGMALEVEDDMMACRKKIITILNEEYGVSESKAYSLIAMEKEEYEKSVVELGLKKVY